MREASVLLALIGGGAAWILHLSAAYALVALGCPRSWPALGWLLAAVTLVCASAAIGTGVFAFRRRGRARRAARGDESAETRRLLFGVGALLAGLFAFMVVAGGLAAMALPPCHGAGIGGRA